MHDSEVRGRGGGPERSNTNDGSREKREPWKRCEYVYEMRGNVGINDGDGEKLRERGEYA